MSDSEVRQLYLAMLKQEMEQRATLFTQLIKEFGPQVLDVVEKSTVEQTRRKLQEMDLARRDLDTVMEILWDQIETDMIELTVVAQSPQRLELEVSRCLFAQKMEDLGAMDIGYAFYCSYDDGFCQGLNPAIRFTRTKTLMRGDSCCNHTYEL